MNIVDAMLDPELFQPWFKGPSWEPWRCVLRAAYALPMSVSDKAFLQAVAAREPPTKRVKELWTIVGRRGGKDSIASLIVAHTAALFDGSDRIRPGERPLCLCLAVDREQAKIVLGYIRSYFQQIPLLAGMITRQTQWGFELSNGVDVAVLANDYRSIRGRTILCAVFDELAFWSAEDSAGARYRGLSRGFARHEHVAGEHAHRNFLALSEGRALILASFKSPTAAKTATRWLSGRRAGRSIHRWTRRLSKKAFLMTRRRAVPSG